MLKVKLTDGTNEYTLPCVDGILSEFASLQSGSYTSPTGIVYNISKSLWGGNQRIYIRADANTNIDEDSLIQAIEDIGLTINTLFIDASSVIGNTASKNLYKIDDESHFPYYHAQYDPRPDSGQFRNQKLYDFSFYTGTSHGMQFTESVWGGGQVITKGYSAPLALIGSDGENYYFGAFLMEYLHGVRSEIHISFEWNTAYSTLTWLDLEFDPGEKGFRPTGARTKKTLPGIGGRPSGGQGKDPEYTSDPITQPGAPDETHASACRLGFIRAYLMSESNLQTFGECLFGSTFEGFLRGLSENPLDFVVSLNIFPCKPYVGNPTAIQLSRFSCISTQSDKALGSDSSGSPLTSQFRTFDFGTVTVNENWGSFLDYAQTEIALYLPFIGTVSIDVGECMGGTINVQYTIDFFTGQCVANVLCTKPGFTLPNGQALSNVHAQHSYQGNVASQIPLTRVDYGAMIGNLINACTQAITNPVAGAMSVVGDTLNGGFRPNVSSKGNLVANSGYCSVLYPYIRITRPITAEPDSYQEVVGYPSFINTTIGQCDGLCVCEDIDVKGIPYATDEELAEIRQLCREGVYN